MTGQRTNEEQGPSLTDHLNQIVEIVHGSTQTKKELKEEIKSKIPALSKKSGVVQNFLSEYVQRGKATGSVKSRQLVNAEKVVSEYVASKSAKAEGGEQSKEDNGESQEGRDMSTKLRTILERRLADEKEKEESQKSKVEGTEKVENV